MSDFFNSTDLDKFLAEWESEFHATDMGFVDLLNPIGYDGGHVDGGGPGPAPPLDPSGIDHVTLPMHSEEKIHEAPIGTQYPTSHEGNLTVNATSSLTYSCVDCDYNTIYPSCLETHAKWKGHKTYRCNAAGCGKQFISPAERDAHQRRPHLEGHWRLETSHPNSCAECKEEFKNRAQLQQHAIEAQHTPFACICGKGFARLDVLYRHIDSFGNEMPKYPCSYCKKHRGKDGFRRRDHLVQHIRGYHKFEAEEKLGDILPSRRGRYGIPQVCPYPGCEFHRGDSFKDLSAEEQRSTKPFSTQAEYTKHMKEAHDFTPFPCNVVGCIKTGKKGYTREKDLINHRNKEHSEAAPYVPKPRDLRIACRFPGCGALLGPNSLSWHRHRGWY
ncbi:CROL alpha [Colletotrichum kahawae]|uniref:CROL alpha n=1 Tax=Colletotrichum kahawae TaxID=34407 RepID=A0AAE0DAT6_COLKA|nr:CROL alpha [Colletotrichum kahawae]